MDTAIMVCGAVVAALGLLGVVDTRCLLLLIQGLGTRWRYYIAVLSRILIGAILVAGAPQSKFPLLLQIFGYLAWAVALLVAVAGPARVEALVSWWMKLAKPLIQLSAAVMALFGAFLVYAVW